MILFRIYSPGQNVTGNCTDRSDTLVSLAVSRVLGTDVVASEGMQWIVLNGYGHALSALDFLGYRGKGIRFKFQVGPVFLVTLVSPHTLCFRAHLLGHHDLPHNLSRLVHLRTKGRLISSRHGERRSQETGHNRNGPHGCDRQKSKG
jgi:hypothetical protein